LERSSLTWRFINRRPEHILPMVGYVGNGRRALEDLLRSRPSWRRLSPSTTYFSRRRSGARTPPTTQSSPSPSSNDLVTKLLAKYNETHDQTQRPSGAYPAERLPSLVAERVINDDRDVPPRYT